MGYYAEYLDQQLSFQGLTNERKAQLARIAELRGREQLVFAADLNKPGSPISVNHSDLLPLQDQVANLQRDSLDLILETPGGSGETAEDIVRLLRSQFGELNVLVPGVAKSAGTIMAMAADEILMEDGVSALGPIDAQMSWQGKTFSAYALLEGLNKIKKDVETNGTLNMAYVPILQGVSPGELEHAQNALDFAKVLVREWLATYKFKNWTHHSSDGRPVTDEEKAERANEIAALLCNHSHWRTHGRSIHVSDLRDMKLKITDYAESPELAEAIKRYFVLLQMTFQTTSIYKVFETPTTQIYRFAATEGSVQPTQKGNKAGQFADIEFKCGNCGEVSVIQANLGKWVPVGDGKHPFPDDNQFHCPKCGNQSDLTDLRRQLEAQSKSTVITEGE